MQVLVDRLQPTLAANEKRFTGRSGAVAGFGAGDKYPQIWLRDSATLPDLTRFHFSRAHLASWIEEHLIHQRPDGSLFDWIAAGPTASFAEWAPKVQLVHRAGPLQISADKNTVEADQESSAVIAAGRFFAFTGDTAWLRKDLGGRSVLQRADAALAYVFKERRDKGTGLVVNAFTADWGDVTPIYPDQRVIYLDDKTPRVVGLYTNALAYEACVALAGMSAAAGMRAAAEQWRGEAERLKAGVDHTLWQPKQGFHRMHAPAPGPAFKADVTDILGTGGHAAAIRAGVVDGHRARRILDVIEARRREMKLSSVSFTLLPPFPAGFFLHPMVKEPWSYQNGGQWDWFGGRLVLAELEHGRAARGREHLLELARKAQRTGGLYEWHTRDGEGRGSGQYAASAGALGAAVIEGLLGVRLRASSLELAPRLDTWAAQARLYEPATATRIDYDYRPAKDEISFSFEVKPARPTQVSLLMPTGWTEATATLDGTRITARQTTVGADAYAVFETDGRSHRVALRRAPRAPRTTPRPR